MSDDKGAINKNKIYSPKVCRNLDFIGAKCRCGKLDKFLITACGLGFIFFCLLHYFSQRPLWLDENFILDNIKSNHIFGPLEHTQAFPRFYLFLIKSFSSLFNYHILSLRFFSLGAMLGAFFVWAKIYRDEFLLSKNFLVAMFSFPSSFYITYYAAELKPYSMDVLVMGLCCFYLSHQKKYLEKKTLSKSFVATTLLLPFTILFSYSSLFVFWLVIYNFLFFLKEKKNILLLFSYIVVSAGCLIFIYHFDIKYTLSLKSLFSYWNDYFLCIKTAYCFIKSFGEGIRRLSVWWFGNSAIFRKVASFFIPYFLCSLFASGFKSLWQKKGRVWGIDAIGLVVFLELFLLGILKKYPFTGERITLFFSPFVFSFLIKGISFFKKYKPLYIVVSLFYVVFLAACSINSFLWYIKLYR